VNKQWANGERTAAKYTTIFTINPAAIAANSVAMRQIVRDRRRGG